jgi:hypothetical protein
MSAKSIVMAVAAAAIVVAATSARAEIANPRQMYAGFNLPELVTVANEIGFEAAPQTLNDGTVILRIETADVIFFAQRTVCNAATCSGLAIYAILSPGVDVPLTSLNEFNSKQSIVAAYKSESAIVLTRYLIGDYGVVKGNVASDLFNFNLRAKEFAAFVMGGGTNTISAKIESGAATAPAAGAQAVQAAYVGRVVHDAQFDQHIDELIKAGGAFKE